MPAPQRIKDLAKKFKDNFDFYQSGDYNEEQLRHEFLNPFFKELGWDLENELGKGADRDVVFEKQMRAGAPDFGFRIDGKLKFFVEAKKPSLKICTDQKAAFQLRSYGFSAKIARSILTDFEELAIYDTSIRPKESDGAKIARTVRCIDYTEYDEKWDEIVALFSRDAVAAGSLDKLEKAGGKHAVDKELLVDISNWREALAKNIALRNAALSEEQVNRFVQDTLDRIIFLRICEDRGIEYGNPIQEAAGETGVYEKLCKIFKKAEKRYDSGLFEKIPQPEQLLIDDSTLQKIISELYYPKSPYKFDAIPAEILGQVYEQFLGKVIRLTDGHHAKVEEKPEVRKAGGVYYTPAYIVEYIVKNTVGKLVEAKTPKQIEKLSVLDPACGSGSFLLGAYQFLMDWYRDWYVANGEEKHIKSGQIYRDKIGSIQLSLAERRKILTAHIYGVDIDRQAVEVAKLSLMLKALEVSEQQTLMNEQMLPNLADNIKCGNSLIGTDYFSGQLSPDPVEMARINPFDWEGTDGFPEIMKRGGFDAVIGNPPYIRPHNLEKNTKDALWRYYRPEFSAKSDIYACFIKQGIELAQCSGLIAYVVSKTWLSLESFHPLRKYILDNCQIAQLALPPKKAFRDATVETVVFVFSKKRNSDKDSDPIIRILELNPTHAREINEVRQEEYESTHLNVFELSLDKFSADFTKKLFIDSKKLGDVIEFSYGIKTGDDSVFLSQKKETPNHKPVLRRSDIGRYRIEWKEEYVWYVPEKMRAHRSTARPGEIKRFENRKIIVQDLAHSLIATLDTDKYFVKDALLLSERENSLDLGYVIAILNSKLLSYCYRKTFSTLSVAKNAILSLPIKNPTSHEFIAKQLIDLSQTMISLQKRLDVNLENHSLQRQIDATDQKIDQLVYKLYGLTEEEINIVEEASK